jgi:hypothetical protein
MKTGTRDSVRFVLLFLLMGVVSNVLANALEKGMTAYDAKDYEAAYQYWRQPAEEGDARAQFFLTLLYRLGRGVELSETKAIYWLKESSDRDYAPAQFNLGNRYFQGDGLEKNEYRAVLLWRKAAEQGFARAQNNLASAYKLGRGVERNEEQALFWYRKAAASGSRAAVKALAAMGIKPGAEEKQALVQKPPKPKPAQQKEIAVTDAGKPTPPISDDAAWIREQPPGNFTIQFHAGQDPAATKRFLGSLKSAEKSAVFSFKRNGQNWEAVILGSFRDRAAAKAAAEKLAPRSKPWIRNFQGIHAIMN